MIVPCRRGFSLVEVVVALFVVSVVLVLAQAMLHTLVLARLARDQDLALTIASHKLEQVRALGYAALPASGPFSDSLQSGFATSSAALTVTDFNAKTKSITVTVWWDEPNNPSPYSISLVTLVTQTGGLP